MWFLCVGALFCGVLGVLSCSSNHMAEETRAGCFTLIVLWLSVFCVLLMTRFDLQSMIVTFPDPTNLLFVKLY